MGKYKWIISLVSVVFSILMIRQYLGFVGFKTKKLRFFVLIY